MLPGTKMDGKDFTEFTKNSRYPYIPLNIQCLLLNFLQNLYDHKFYWIILPVSDARYRCCTAR